VAFVLRVAILFRSEYPPSTDIGLHSNVLNLILDSGQVPTWNPYHMGGEPLTNTPGFYLFASFLVLLTGMPQLTAQALIAALFSAFTVFPAYLIARKIWKNNSVGLLGAFFVAVSTFSIEMLGWGGYPNIVSLTLIGIVVFVFLKNSNQPHFFKLIIMALLLGALALTHLLSFFVLLSVWLGYIILLHKRLLSCLPGVGSIIRFSVDTSSLELLHRYVRTRSVCRRHGREQKLDFSLQTC
jgi:hypothetical protein